MNPNQICGCNTVKRSLFEAVNTCHSFFFAEKGTYRNCSNFCAERGQKKTIVWSGAREQSADTVFQLNIVGGK